MGAGSWDTSRYTSQKQQRVTSNVDDFAYSSTATDVHDNLDPKRINNKPVGKLESRDSAEHPESNAVFVCFDVTGSNIANAREAQKKLPNLMELLKKYIPDPQVAVAANDDIHVQPSKVVQISDFESDNRVDEHLRNIILVGDGGGNGGESYDLIVYAAARKTVLDCFEKRGRKGYFFMYADELFFPNVEKKNVKHVFGDTIEKDIPVAEILEELKKTYHVFLIWPGGLSQHGYDEAREQYVTLLGEDHVLTLQHPNLICELIGATIGINEEMVSEDNLVQDLVSVGTSKSDATGVTNALAPFIKHKGTGTLAKSSKGSAARL